jgi:poly(A) polymerase Pap1
MITAEQIAESLMNGSVIHQNAVRHEVGLMERVGKIITAAGLELRHESDVYVCKGHDTLLKAKAAKDAADKAAEAAKLAADKADHAKVVADQAAQAAKTTAVGAPVGNVEAERAAWDKAHGLKPGEYDRMTPEQRAAVDAKS